MSSALETPRRIDEPREAALFSQVISDVAANQRSVIVQRNGTDIAAVIPFEYLELLQEALAAREVEKLSRETDWKKVVAARPFPQEWFDRDEPKPF